LQYNVQLILIKNQQLSVSLIFIIFES
jgi:hypothetical protein